ncbi:cytochrome C assembly protein [Ornithinibacillus gellani]|uniref:cytochrome c biogenesis protein CcsA n=1 Tax=Ornithinibacillus gellani TaxID=2293253 RepID=UPI000F467E9D|nr:cytochrome c biogenesis protein CcsA [Ornithinibacillus gellani]TQS76118.1 cytochrome C assembly protein [Ornithinibacillus gellani]
MYEAKWFYELILIIYGLSVVGYFIDFIQHNRKANRVAFWFLCIVWSMQTIYLVIQVFVQGVVPFATVLDSLFFYSWILVSFSLLINRIFHVHFIILFTNIFSFFILLVHILSRAEGMQGTGIELVHEVLIAHIVLTIISYGFFTLSFLFSFMYQMQYYMLKDKRGLRWLWRFADLKKLDSLAFVAITIGTPILFIGLILGFVWASVAETEFYFFDMKVLGSVIVLIVYSVYLLLRLLAGYRGKTIAMYNAVAFLCLLINFFLFSTLSNFHFN